MWKLAAGVSLLPGLATVLAQDDGVTVSTFGDASNTELEWVTANDPVMGGHSESTYRKDSKNHLGIWSGTVRNVLPYAFPGFCSIRSEGDLPDLSATAGLTVNLREAVAGGLDEFRVNVMSVNTRPGGGSYEAAFIASSGMESHTVPWEDFKCKYRGDVDQDCEDSFPLTGELHQLSSVGLSVGEKVGDFSIEFKSVVAHGSRVAQVQQVHGRMVSTFGGASDRELGWETVNDPVMGGRSESTFREDAKNHRGIWSGTVRNVLPYAFPGFCTLRSVGDLPDLSATAGLTVKLRQAITKGLFEFRVNVMSENTRPDGGSYEVKFIATSSMESHAVPWNAFVCKFRGEVDESCNPLTQELHQLSSVGLSVGEQVGSFSIELESVVAHGSAGASKEMLV